MKSFGRFLSVLVAFLSVAQKSPGHRVINYPRWTDLFPLSVLGYPFLPQRNTIMYVLERNEFSTLASLLARSGLAFSLSGGGPGTLFAPTNRAFAALSPRTLRRLHRNHGFLKNVLLGHLVGITLYSSMLSNNMKINSVAGTTLTITENFRGIAVNGANIVRADIKASKGVIHGIDKVLLPYEESPESILEVAAENGFSTFIVYAQEAGLDSLLEGEGPYTIFAPTNEAFAAVPPETLNDLRTNKILLKIVLLQHITNSKLYSRSLTNGLEVNSLAGNPLKFQVNFRGKSVNGAKIVKTDIETPNAVIHTIDELLLTDSEKPTDSLIDTAVEEGLTQFATYVQNAGLESALAGEGPFTVFAPENRAFSSIPSRILRELQADSDLWRKVLLGHAVKGEVYSFTLSDGLRIKSLANNILTFQVTPRGTSVNGSNIEIADIKASNGIIHVIDKVILPDLERPSDSLIDIAVVNGLTQFVTYAQNAGLGPTLIRDGPFTIFAPTNRAFSAIPSRTLEELQGNPDLMEKVLLGHVINGELYSFAVSDGMQIESLANNILTFQVDRRGISVNGSNIETADIKASNGIIHVIDKVILPMKQTPSGSIVETAAANELSSFVEALEITGLTNTLTGEGPFTVFAPTNEAFDTVPTRFVREFQANPALLRKAISGHVVKGKVYSSALSDGFRVNSLAGNTLKFQVDRVGITVNGAYVVKRDLEASNGIVHAIDKFLLPDEETQNSVLDVAIANGFTRFAAYVEDSGLESTLNGGGPFTVFVPTNEAFLLLPFSTLEELQRSPAFLERVLLSHVARARVYSDELFSNLEIQSLSGNPLRFQVDALRTSVNGANIVRRDIETKNGLIHAIDKVILPEDDVMKPGSILDVASENGYSTFVLYVQNSGLASALDGDEIFTIFVPTNEAFNNLPESTLDDLDRDSEYLRQVLTTLVVRGRLFTSSLSNNLVVDSLSGTPLVFGVFGRSITVNGANIVKPDLEASESVMHAIDRVLLPRQRSSEKEIKFVDEI